MVVKTNAESSSYTLDNDDGYPYYASELKPYRANDTDLFPGREHPKPGPIMTDDNCYLVCWVGYRPEDEEWLPAHMLKNCEALDKWMENGGDRLIGPASAK